MWFNWLITMTRTLCRSKALELNSAINSYRKRSGTNIVPADAWVLTVCNVSRFNFHSFITTTFYCQPSFSLFSANKASRGAAFSGAAALTAEASSTLSIWPKAANFFDTTSLCSIARILPYSTRVFQTSTLLKNMLLTSSSVLPAVSLCGCTISDVNLNCGGGTEAVTYRNKKKTWIAMAVQKTLKMRYVFHWMLTNAEGTKYNRAKLKIQFEAVQSATALPRTRSEKSSSG